MTCPLCGGHATVTVAGRVDLPVRKTIVVDRRIDGQVRQVFVDYTERRPTLASFAGCDSCDWADYLAPGRN